MEAERVNRRKQNEVGIYGRGSKKETEAGGRGEENGGRKSHWMKTERRQKDPTEEGK